MKRFIACLLICFLSVAVFAAEDSTSFTFDAIKSYHSTDDWQYSLKVVDRLGADTSDDIYQGELISDNFSREIDLNTYPLSKPTYLFDIVYDSKSQNETQFVIKVTFGDFVNLENTDDVIKVTSSFELVKDTNNKNDGDEVVNSSLGNEHTITVQYGPRSWQGILIWGQWEYYDDPVSYIWSFYITAPGAANHKPDGSAKQGLYQMDVKISVETE